MDQKREECVNLETDADLEKAKLAYTVRGRIQYLKLAVFSVSNPNYRKTKFKRKITFDDNKEDDEFDELEARELVLSKDPNVKIKKQKQPIY